MSAEITRRVSQSHVHGLSAAYNQHIEHMNVVHGGERQRNARRQRNITFTDTGERPESRVRLQQNGHKQVKPPALQPLPTDHDHAGLIQLRRRRPNHPGDDDQSPHEFGSARAELCNIWSHTWIGNDNEDDIADFTVRASTPMCSPRFNPGKS